MLSTVMWPSLIFTGFPQSGEISPLKELVTSILGCEQGGGRILLRLEFRFVEDWYSPLSFELSRKHLRCWDGRIFVAEWFCKWFRKSIRKLLLIVSIVNELPCLNKMGHGGQARTKNQWVIFTLFLRSGYIYCIPSSISTSQISSLILSWHLTPQDMASYIFRN